MSLDIMKQVLRAAEFADLFIKELVTGSTNREVAKQVLSEAITALRAAIEHAERSQTHSEECWRWHHQCAVAKIEQLQQGTETLYAMYEQASTQRDAVMAQQQQIVNNWKLLAEAHEVIFKAVANRTHWKRTAIRYLKRNVRDLYLQAENEWKARADSNERFY